MEAPAMSLPLFLSGRDIAGVAISRRHPYSTNKKNQIHTRHWSAGAGKDGGRVVNLYSGISGITYAPLLLVFRLASAFLFSPLDANSSTIHLRGGSLNMEGKGVGSLNREGRSVVFGWPDAAFFEHRSNFWVVGGGGYGGRMKQGREGKKGEGWSEVREGVEFVLKGNNILSPQKRGRF